MNDPSPSWPRYLYHRMFLKPDVRHDDMKTELRRCLSTWQLTLLGIGSTIGVGIYVLLGVMAKEEAGPSVIVSFLIATVVTLMNALVFAEFSTHVPQTGATYIYLYKVFGEFAAFLVGSIIVLSGMFSSSVGARAWSGMLDSFFNNTIQDYMETVVGKIQIGPPFSEHLDVVACIFQAVVTVIVSCNIFCTSIINTVLGLLTSSVLVFVFIVGLICGDAQNFLNTEHGGLFPFGAAGVIRAASLALYATSGFEVISMSSEECKNPAKSIPRAMMAELTVVGLVYIGASVGMIFLIPFWLIDLRAPLPSAFEYSGLMWGKVIVTVGPMFGITNLQLLGMYGLSRTVYRMSKDGLFFSLFVSVDKSTGVPRKAAVLAGVFTSCFSLLCDLSYIVKMSVVLMLLSYISVGPALICLRVKESRKSAEFSLLPLDKDEEEPVLHLQLAGSEELESLDRQSPDTKILAETRSATVVSTSDIVLGHAHFGTDTTENSNQLLANTVVLQASSDAIKDLDALAEFSDMMERKPHPSENDKESFSALNGFREVSKGKYSIPETGALLQHVEEEISPFSSTASFEHDGLFTQLREMQNGSSLHKHTPEGSRTTAQSVTGLSTSRQVAVWLSPFVPGVLSSNCLILLHLVACVTLSALIIYGQADLIALQPVAVLACGMLCSLLFLFSFFLWALCANHGEVQSESNFQTPLMPLIPTLSMVLSSMMLFSAAEKTGVVEIVVMVVMVTVVYLLMTLLRFRSSRQPKDAGRRAPQQAEEQGEEAQALLVISPHGEAEHGSDEEDMML